MKILDNKRILVTGGAGFIGSHIVDQIVELGARVTVIDDLSSGTMENIKHHQDRIEFIKGDILDENLMRKVLDKIDMICHQAALRSVPKSVERPFDYHNVNVTGTLKMFLIAREKGIKRIVCASSSSVYGDRTDFPEKETDPVKPFSPYAATKLMNEHYAYIFTEHYNMEIVCLRYFNVFGPRQSLENKYAVVIPKFITSLLNDQQPPVYGDGEQERDFTYISDVVSANILALTKDGVKGEVFNIAEGNPKSVNYLFNAIKDILSKDIAPIYEEIRAGDVRKTHASIEKAEKLLGWKPRVSFKEGLIRTIDWFKNLHHKH